MKTLPDPCNHCEARHSPTFLCPPAKQILDAVTARGRSYDMPTLAFDDPMPLLPGTDHPGDTLMAQLSVQAAIVPIFDVPRAALMFTGVAADGQPLPRWLLVNTDERIRAAAKLVNDMAELAITRAAALRGASDAN